MSEPSPFHLRERSHFKSPPSLNSAALISWLMIQVFPLGISAIRVPLWARGNSPNEDWATAFLFAMQVAGSSLLFPWLLSSLWQSISTILIALPFVLLGVVLSRGAFGDALWYAANITLWLAGLSIWSVVFQTTKWHLIAVSICSSAVFGGATLIYLMTEFADSSITAAQITKWLPITFMCNLGSAIIAASVYRKLRAKLSTVIY